jgi:aquaporin Z
MTKKITAEFIGTLWLVLGGCGSAVLAAGIPSVGIGLLGVSLAFGLTVVTIAYAFGHVSGAHLNPAVTLGLWMGGRFESKDILPYIGAQVLGAITGAGILAVIATGNGKEIGDFAANGYGEHSPMGYNLAACLLTEVVMTFVFLLVILGATDDKAPKGFGGLAIGLCLALIHLISIPVTNTSVNPARSISQAVFVGDWAIEQV